MSDFESVSGKQEIFVPFTMDKRFWDETIPNIFLNKVYEEQIEKGEEIHYTTLVTSYTYKNDERFQQFCMEVTEALGRILNQYHGLNEESIFWRKLLYLWVINYSSSIRFKIEQLNNFLATYPKEEYAYFSCAKINWKEPDFLFADGSRIWGLFAEEEYHYISYLWIAQKYYGFQFIEKCVGAIPKAKKEECLGLSLYDVASVMLRGFRGIKRFLLNAVPASRFRVGTYAADYGLFSSLKWFLWSRGSIQPIVVPHPDKSKKIDIIFRNSLVEEILKYVDANEEEKMVLEFLPMVLPCFFVENFKSQYEAASRFIDGHPNLAIIYTLTHMIQTSTEKICMLLLQKRGGKILGQQHGGTYQVTTSEQENVRELELDDVFYYWGKSALSYKIEEFPNCKILFGPTQKLGKDGIRTFIARMVSKIKKPMRESILFTGTALEAYPRSYHQGNSTGEAMEYMERKLRFLSALSDKAKSLMLVREFPVDYGWHVGKRIETEVPEIRISIKERFDDVLRDCSMLISDHLATTWIEALYLGKPVIFLLFDYEISIQNYKFRKEEKTYIDMLADVGIIIYSPEEAAKLVNHLVEYGIMAWWMNEERQRVMRIVRERWTTKVDDIDKWWYRELMARAKELEQQE